MRDILSKLQGGDTRSIGRANEIAGEIVKDPALFPALFAGMLHEDELIRARAADVVEKVTAKLPHLLQPYKRQLLQTVSLTSEKIVRWHVAQMLPRLLLTESEKARAVSILTGYLKDDSSIVRTFSMQGLADFAACDRKLLPEILPLIERLTRSGTPAMRSRGQKLLKMLRALR